MVNLTGLPNGVYFFNTKHWHTLLRKQDFVYVCSVFKYA